MEEHKEYNYFHEREKLTDIFRVGSCLGSTVNISQLEAMEVLGALCPVDITPRAREPGGC